MKKHLLLMTMLTCLVMAFGFSSCSSDDDEPSESAESIMDLVNGRSFSCLDPNMSGDTFNDYKYYIGFYATEETSGTFFYRLDWKDMDVDGTYRGSIVAEGVFTVSGGKIKVSINRGECGITTLEVVSGCLKSNTGLLFQSYGEQTADGTGPTSVFTHNYDLDHWQFQYNMTISQITGLFSSLQIAAGMGDTVEARKLASSIKSYQASAKEIREEAAADGWTIQKDPYETKSVGSY